MTLEQPFLHMQASLLASRDGGDAVRRAAVLTERVLKQVLSLDPAKRIGLGDMLGMAHRDPAHRERLGSGLIKRLNWLNEMRKQSVHDKGGGSVELSVDEGQRAVDIATDLLVQVDAFTREQVARLARKAEWQASGGPSDAVLTLDRATQRNDFENLVIRPHRLIVLVIHGEAGQGHEYFGQVMKWKLQATRTGRWTELRVEWPAPSDAPGVRLAYVLESLASALGTPLGVSGRIPDTDPMTDAGARAWTEALQPAWRRLETSRQRLCVRHSLEMLHASDAAVCERYLELFWMTASRRARERLILSFEIAWAVPSGIPLVGKSWRLSRRERQASERIIDTLENIEVPTACRCHALDELTSATEDDVVTWLRNERNQPRAKAEKQASEIIAATDGGRFELVVRRVSAMSNRRFQESIS